MPPLFWKALLAAYVLLALDGGCYLSYGWTLGFRALAFFAWMMAAFMLVLATALDLWSNYKMSVVHFAKSNYCACGQHIYGSTMTIAFENSWGAGPVESGQNQNVLHTTIAEDVTCENCKKSDAFTAHLKQLEAEGE